MRELTLVGPLPPPTGGVASHVAGVASALLRRGTRVRVVDPGRGKVSLGVELLRTGARGGLLHVHVSGHALPSYALAGLCAAGPTPCVVTLHSGLAPRYLAELTPARRMAASAVLDRMRAVVCVSESIAGAVRELGLDDDKVIVASPFIAEAVRPGTAPGDALALRARTPRLIAAAVAPGPEYGADVLADGFARVAAFDPWARLCVFGPGGADRDVVRALGARGLDDRAWALGELDPSAAHAVIALADLFVRPTRADGDALSVREARALGRRVVASDAAARPEGVTTFAAGDAGALAQAILATLSAPAPEAAREDGLPALIALYQRLSPEEDLACVASPAV